MAQFLRPLKKTIKSFRRNPLMHLASIGTIGVSCLILGTFLLCYRNFETIAEKTNPHLTGTVYLKEGLSEPQLADLREELLSYPAVKKVTYKPKAKVANELQAFLGASHSEILPGSELFPDLMELEFSREVPALDLTVLKSQLNQTPLIAEVDFSEDWLSQYKKVRSFLTMIGWVLIIALVLGCSFIIANFMGIRHQARKEEMEIVQLIGAERSFVIAPFMWEGLVEGILGAAFAMGFLMFSKWGLGDVLARDWNSLLGISSWMFLSWAQIILLLFIGITMALLGSLAVFFRTAGHSHS